MIQTGQVQRKKKDARARGSNFTPRICFVKVLIKKNWLFLNHFFLTRKQLTRIVHIR